MLTANWWPWYDFELHARVPARSFRPVPAVDGGLFTMTRRETPLTTLVRLAKLRWRSEYDYRGMKQALGLFHFEGRTWNGWHHHVTLVSVTHAFRTLQRLARAPKAPCRPEPPPSRPRAPDNPCDSEPAPAPPICHRDIPTRIRI
jgi:hypothetical protein